LFEGFVSFKDAATDHLTDVLALRKIAKNPRNFVARER
jgi:hypothetical protein